MYQDNILANAFLPSMQGTKLSFMRDLLSDKKLHLKQNDVNRMEVPNYQELSVKNLYADAMKDPVLEKYLLPRSSSQESFKSEIGRAHVWTPVTL